jgi:hypothetical protein
MDCEQLWVRVEVVLRHYLSDDVAVFPRGSLSVITADIREEAHGFNPDEACMRAICARILGQYSGIDRRCRVMLASAVINAFGWNIEAHRRRGTAFAITRRRAAAEPRRKVLRSRSKNKPDANTSRDIRIGPSRPLPR